MTAEEKQFVDEFLQMRNMAELRALSSVSLERPLEDAEYNRMMALKKEVFEYA